MTHPMRRLALALALACTAAGLACDPAVSWCVEQGGDPDQCAAQWGTVACEPVVQPDSTTCCAAGTGTPVQPQCGR